MSGLALRVVGKGALERADIEPALADMKRKLMERNVAEEVSEQVVESLARSLEGQKLSSFTGGLIWQGVQNTMLGVLGCSSACDVLACLCNTGHLEHVASTQSQCSTHISSA